MVNVLSKPIDSKSLRKFIDKYHKTIETKWQTFLAPLHRYIAASMTELKQTSNIELTLN